MRAALDAQLQRELAELLDASAGETAPAWCAGPRKIVHTLRPLQQVSFRIAGHHNFPGWACMLGCALW
jgi:hypothetical protein